MIRPARRSVKRLLLHIKPRPSTATLRLLVPSDSSRLLFLPNPLCSEDGPMSAVVLPSGHHQGSPIPVPHHTSLHITLQPPCSTPLAWVRCFSAGWREDLGIRVGRSDTEFGQNFRKFPTQKKCQHRADSGF
jgi:hypothetical protein